MSAGSLQAVSRTVTLAPGAGLAVWGWAAAGQPFGSAHAAAWHAAGLGIFLAAGLLAWSALAVTAACLRAPVLAGGIVPRRVRCRYRQRLIARGIPREAQRSSYISKRLRRVTYAADRHRCAGCGVRHVRFQVDHIIPWAAGGLTALTNTMTLCPACNGIKSNYSRDRDGYEHYHGDRKDIYLARKILAREKRHRWNPLRMVRAAWALAS